MAEITGKKNPAAVSLDRKDGKTRAETLSPEELSDQERKAVATPSKKAAAKSAEVRTAKAAKKPAGKAQKPKPPSE